jgi:nicotinate-nucleotide adenylyltransferase
VRIGILGGTFDPPHVGHLLVASDAVEALHLDRLVFVPNARQPLKSHTVLSDPEDRLSMVRLAIGTDARFAVDDLEVVRGGTSFTVDTLEQLSARDPASQWFLLLGADAGTTFAQWRSPRRVAELATLAIMRRAGDATAPTDEALIAGFQAVIGPGAAPPMMIATRRVDVSSTEIRERVRTGRSIHGFVPEAVARFLQERGLYQSRHA